MATFKIGTSFKNFPIGIHFFTHSFKCKIKKGIELSFPLFFLVPPIFEWRTPPRTFSHAHFLFGGAGFFLCQTEKHVQTLRRPELRSSFRMAELARGFRLSVS